MPDTRSSVEDILETRSGIQDLPEFQNVVGDATRIAQDGCINLLFNAKYLESCGDAGAKTAINEIRNYAKKLELAQVNGIHAEFSIIDFSFPHYQPRKGEMIYCGESFASLNLTKA